MCASIRAISYQVCGFGGTGLLSAVVNPEVLDADNKWECSGCKSKVQATKCQEVSNLPSRLFLHLKRFRFDPVSLC
jgi:ubiquitin C-terminal hydrolase